MTLATSRTLAVAFLSLAFASCSSAPTVGQQKYAQLKNEWTFENDFPTVWKGIEQTLANHRVVDRDPEEVSEVEMKNLTERTLETDWIYAKSRDKFIEFKVNGLPKKQYLQVRFKYIVTAKTIIGGTHVKVNATEEIEQLDSKGKPDGYDEVDSPDSSRSNELLEKVKLSILSS